MDVTADTTTDGVRERVFHCSREGATIPGVVWSPAGADGSRPKVLFGHGGMQDKHAPNIVALAHHLVRHLGYAAVCIDAPGHGDRVTPEERAALRRRLLGADPSQRTDRGNTAAPYLASFSQGVEDWRVVLDDVERLSDVGSGPTGWWGVSMGTSIGLPFVATEPRFDCAVLGLASAVERPGYADYLGWAASLAVPVLFLSQRDDTGHPIERVLELWDLIGAPEKSLHLNPGPHVGVPGFERAESAAFFRRHLGRSAGAARQPNGADPSRRADGN